MARFGSLDSCDIAALESAFIGIADLGRSVYSFLLVRWMLKADLDTRAAVATTGAAAFVLHGKQGGLVPFEHGANAMVVERLRPLVANS